MAALWKQRCRQAQWKAICTMAVAVTFDDIALRHGMNNVATRAPTLSPAQTHVVIARRPFRGPCKVPPGVAGHPVYLDTSTAIHLGILILVIINFKHISCCSPTLSAPHGFFGRLSNTQYALQYAKSVLPSLLTPTLSATYTVGYETGVLMSIRKERLLHFLAERHGRNWEINYCTNLLP